MSNKVKCPTCGAIFKNDGELTVHLTTSVKCDVEVCPECLSQTSKAELQTFGGLCETCAEGERADA